jgi:hypothetical protein
VNYDEGQSRASANIEAAWKADDKNHVTRRVERLGDGGYRYTTMVDDMVQVTVKGFNGFRELTLEVSQGDSSDEGVAALEKVSEHIGFRLLAAS